MKGSLAARVLQPLDTVIRLHERVVHRVAVREQHVGIAVLVQVHDLDARRAPVRMRRLVEDPRHEREISLAAVDVGDDGLVLLRDQRDEIQLSVLVQIDRDDVNCARARIDDVRDERRLAERSSLVFEDRDVPCRPPPECGDRKIGLAVAVEIARFDVGDAGNPSAQNPPNFPLPSAAHPDDRAVGVIAREELAEIRDEQILQSVPVDVGERHVIGMRDVGDDLQGVSCGSWPQNTVPWYISVPITSSLPSPSKSASCTLDTRRIVRRVGHAQTVAGEFQRRLGDRRPRLRRLETLGSVGLHVAQRRRHVGRELDGAEIASRLRPLVAQVHHLRDLVVPLAARKTSGVGGLWH